MEPVARPKDLLGQAQALLAEIQAASAILVPAGQPDPVDPPLQVAGLPCPRSARPSQSNTVPLTPPAFQVACHYFSGDATNARVWRGSKVHSLEMRSVYLLDSSSLSADHTVLSSAVHENFLADLQASPLLTYSADPRAKMPIDTPRLTQIARR